MTLLGTHRADITPPGPTSLAGYASRAALGPAETVLSPLQLRTFVLGARNESPVVIVGADLLWWSDELVRTLRTQVRAHFDIPEQNLVLHATHTHSGPQTCRYMTPSLGTVDPNYVDHLRRTTLASIEAALGERTPVRIEIGRAMADVSVNRRWARTAGQLPSTPIDRELTAVRFVDEAGQSVAAFVHFACHPVVHHGHAFSSDFPGALTTELESDIAPVVMYLQGCCGDVNPDRYGPAGSFHDGGQPEIDRMGQDLAGTARLAFGAAQDAGRPRVNLSRAQVDLPLQDRIAVSGLRRLAANDDYIGEWARLMLDHPDRYTRTPFLDMVRVDLSERLRLLAMPAEPFSLFGLHAKRVSGHTCLPMGYTDGMTTYLMGAGEHAEGGYEPEEAPFYMGMPAALAPSVESVVLEAITDMVAGPALQRPAAPQSVTNS
ncbi:neutral/alkaline non-lysosomal ceramidase N-terminal domain-containing protein [Pseudactinotalea sp. Z1748]|uniref:neutral/alkaline non-lysosomal ceramidase N-terminal domain-containing protein n=1 Tax=Pseudactinotalea sp. Z1748 TaxID=3413027 RepID=UPI003C7ECA0B